MQNPEQRAARADIRNSSPRRSLRRLLCALVPLCSIGVASNALALPNLTVTKTASQQAAMPGADFSYRLTARNIGPDGAVGTVTIMDTLPSGVGYSGVDIEPDLPFIGWVCGMNGSTLTCTRTGLNANTAAASITVNVTAPSLPAGAPPIQITNTAVVGCASCAESNTSDNSGAVTTTVGRSDLALQKFADDDTVPKGAPLRYQLFVTNGSTAPDSSTVSVADALPPGVVGVHAWGFGWTCGVAGQNVQCQTSGIPPAIPPAAGVASPITIEAFAPAQTGPVVNTATVGSPADGTPGNNAGSATIAVQDAPSAVDLAVTNVGSGAPTVPSGFAYDYVLTASNNSPSAGAGVVTVKAVLPDSSVTLMDIVEGNEWTCASEALEFGVPQTLVTCTSQGIAASATVPVATLKVFAGAVGSARLRAWVSGTADTNTANNVADASKLIVASSAPDLTITSTSDPAIPSPVGRGLPYSYTLNVANLGPGVPSGTTTVTDILPEGVTYTGATGNGWACASSDGTVTCTRTTSFTIGAPAITVTATAPMAPGLLTNHAFVTNSNGDSDPTNNASEVQTAVANAVPQAIDDLYSTESDQTLTVSVLEGVLSNDHDDDDHLTAIRGVLPTNGELTFHADGSFVYVPNAGYSGWDSFTYKANDSDLDSPNATVRIAIGNQPPEIVDQQFAIAEDLPVDPATPIYTVTANDDGMVQPLVYTILSGNEDGAFALDAATGAVTVAGSLDHEIHPSYSLLVQVSDGTFDASATLTIGVTDVANGPGEENKTPTAVDDAVQVAPGGSAHTLINGEDSLLFNDSDQDGNDLSANLISDPQHGSVDVFSDGTFVYTNTGGDPATVDEFTYEACDPAPACSSATVTVTITNGPLNRLPIAVDDAIVVAPGGTADTLTGGATSVLANDFDPDNDALSFEPLGPPSHGAVTFSDDGSFLYTNNANDPAATDSFTYQVCDTHGACAPGTVTVTIANDLENHLPFAVDDAIQVVPGGTSSVLIGGASSVLVNDDDSDGDALTAILLSTPSHGVLTFDTDGSFNYENDPNDASPTDNFYYEACDTHGACFAGKVTITVTNGALNHLPIAVGDAIQVTPAGTATTLVGGATSVLANDSDLDGDPLKAKLLVNPSAGQLTLLDDGTFSYAHTPAGGNDTFLYEACDSHGACMAALVTVTVDDFILPDNLPEVVDDAIEVSSGGTASVLVGGSTSVLANDNDVDVGDVMTATMLSTSAHGTLTLWSNGTFSYVNDGGDPSTSDSFVYQACDSYGACDAGEVAITISPSNGNNTPPAIDPNQTFSIAEDKPVGTFVDTVQAHDDGLPQGSSLAYSIVNGNIGTAFAIDPLSGDITVANPLDYEMRSGYILTVNVSDGDLETEAPVTITITDVVGGPGVENRPPVVVDDAIQVVPNGTASVLIGGANSVLANDSDPDGDALHATLLTPPAAGTLSLDPVGTFSYTNTDGSALGDSFEYRTCDTSDVCTTGVVSITITDGAANQLPQASDDAIVVGPGGVANMLMSGFNSVLANDNDADGDVLSATVVSLPSHGMLVLNPDGTFNYANDVTDPAPSDSFLYEACDTYGACEGAEVAITVSQAMPVVNCILPTQVHEAGESVLLDLGPLFTAPPGQGLTYSESGLPLSLSVDAGTGLLSGILAAGEVAGSPYLGTLSATTVPGGAMVSESVNFVVFASGEILLRNGFDGNTAGQPCQ